jgi:hypothetical protein
VGLFQTLLLPASIGLEAAAGALGVGPSVDDGSGGRIPHVQLGRYVRYRRSAVWAWLEEIEAR